MKHLLQTGKLLFAFLTTMLLLNPSIAQVYKHSEPLTHTYSIVARDSITGEMGVAVQSQPEAMEEYRAAMKLFPHNLEMQYWTAITLANNVNLDEAIPMLKKIYSKDRNWKESTRRLPKVNLITLKGAELEKLLSM